jgi:hypothetical protein
MKVKETSETRRKVRKKEM